MNRYIDESADLVAVFNKVLDERFPHLNTLTFKLIFDTKKRVSKGKVVLASIELANEKLRFFTTDNSAPEGYDYIVTVDALAWQYAQPKDKERLLSHELCHVHIDEKGKLKLVGHDVEDFGSEIARNVDDPNWGIRLVSLVQAVYEQTADAEEGNEQENIED